MSSARSPRHSGTIARQPRHVEGENPTPDGIKLRNTIVQLSSTTPFILRDKTGEEKPATKVWIDNIPMSVADSEIKEALVKAGCKLRSSIKLERTREADNKLTRFLMGRRFLCITVHSRPLDESPRVNNINANVYHQEQKSSLTYLLFTLFHTVASHLCVCKRYFVQRVQTNGTQRGRKQK